MSPVRAVARPTWVRDSLSSASKPAQTEQDTGFVFTIGRRGQGVGWALRFTRGTSSASSTTCWSKRD